MGQLLGEVRLARGMVMVGSLGVRSDCFALEIHLCYHQLVESCIHLSLVSCDDLVCPCVYPCACPCPDAQTARVHHDHHVILRRTPDQAGRADLEQGAEEGLAGRLVEEKAWDSCAGRWESSSHFLPSPSPSSSCSRPS